LLSDVLDGLLSMTADNWPDLCAELADLLRPAIAAANQPNAARPTPIRKSLWCAHVQVGRVTPLRAAQIPVDVLIAAA
jgi:hypothetical protein